MSIVVAVAVFVVSCGSSPAEVDPGPPVGTMALLQTSTTVAAPSEPISAVDAGLPWWNDRVFYEVFVRSFADSDGDGMGDLAGVTDRLDYLNDGDPATSDDLGVTGIWLMPVFESPSYHGYDVVDYRSIEGDYGNLDDFERFLDAAHERGIAVVLDLVINHTSDRHPWFSESVRQTSERADWYIWSDDDPGWVGPWGQEVWHRDGDRFYYGLFWKGMPDLNLANTAVTREMHDIAGYWLGDVGVDGFRLDAARHLIEEGSVQQDTAETRAWLSDFRASMHVRDPGALVLGEVWSDTETIAAYVPESLDLAFEFGLSDAFMEAMGKWDAAPLIEAERAALDAYPDGQFAPFLTNHDMDRIMSRLGGNKERAKLAATWLLTAPGVPFVYYGEEIGMEGEKPDERIRTPMAWTGEPPSVGFTVGIPWEAPDLSFRSANVADERADPDSVLSRYRTLIHARNRSEALRFGETVLLETSDPALFASLRRGTSEQVLTILNLSGRELDDYTIDATMLDPALTGVGMVGTDSVPPITSAAYRPTPSLGPFAALVIRFS